MAGGAGALGAAHLLLAVTHGLLPGGLLLWLWARPSGSQLDWLLRLSIVAGYTLWLFLAGRWDFISYHARFLPLVLLVAAAAASWPAARHAPLFAPAGFLWWVSFGGRLLVLAPLALLVVQAIGGRRHEGEPVALDFPFRGGTYYVAQGGGTTVLNYHVAVPPQRYALDIVALDRLGRKRRLFGSGGREDFHVYGRTVHSPCDGEVFLAEDGLPDHLPPASDPERPAGNHVWLRCGDTYVVLAHLMRGSVAARTGEGVARGQPLARVGNSGNTSEPHLHLHAARFAAPPPADTRFLLRKGAAVPILFGGRFLRRNDVFREGPHLR